MRINNETTWRVGTLTATRHELIAAFGQPVDGEWRMRFHCGTLATIYRHKRNPNWSVGGQGPRAFELISQALNE